MGDVDRGHRGSETLERYSAAVAAGNA
jgi:hypothetical protein